MKVKNLLKLIAPEFVRKFDDIQTRLKNLEMCVDCLINSPKYISSNDVGFNGQLQRKRIFLDLISAIKFEIIVETGTWIGNTTGYMAEIPKIHIYTCELNPRFFSIAKMRLKEFNNITFELGDSRQFLKNLSNNNLTDKTTFFYLDAHWYGDLPLGEEIDIIASHWSNFVIMIDDFKVPNDDSYGYDDYGKNNRLSLELLAEQLNENHLIPFFPAFSAKEETGAKRGCVVIARMGSYTETLSKVSSLVKALGF